MGPKRRSYGTETVVNVPVSVPGPIRDGTETGAHRTRVGAPEINQNNQLVMKVKRDGDVQETFEIFTISNDTMLYLSLQTL